MKNSNKGSYLMQITAMLIFGTIGIFRRYIPIGSGMLACYRGLMGTVCLSLFVKAKGRKLFNDIGAKKAILLAITGGLMGFNWILLFEAYNNTTIAIATLCYYMQPTIVILLSPIVFGEKLTVRKLLCAGTAVIGMVFVSGIMEGRNGGSNDVRGILFGLGAAALYASVVIMNKKVQIEDAYEKTVIQLAAAGILLIPYVLLTESFAGIALDTTAVIGLLIVGVVHTGAAYALYFGSMSGLKAQSIAILSYIDPVFALILSALILNEKMTVFGVIGAVMIIGAAILGEISPKLANEAEATK